MNYQPVRAMLLVKEIRPEAVERRTESGLFLPEVEVKNNLAHATVVAVGEDYINAHGVNVTAGFNVGDVVVFKNHQMVDRVAVNGEPHLLFASSEVLAKVV